ncbi:MAG: diaminopropionate ammonia-lyase [Clostridia bacterium]|nr:diaminopropionate ammonia-lyase [Clostridia bacterium]MBQ9252138.1 diaminopropionate ammonia-lyase [Clostridia bacterium]
MEYHFSEFDVIDQSDDIKPAKSHVFSKDTAAITLAFHQGVPGYAPTQLVHLHSLAKEMGIRDILVKDESTRFHLKAFKGLGGSYAMFRILCEKLGLNPETTCFNDLRQESYAEACAEMHFVTATDGNHGKGVSWAAGIFGCQASIFMPAGTVESRRQAIEEAGSGTAVITNLNYDGTVAYAARMAEEKGWILIQDTAWEGYEKYPQWISEGYLTMAQELKEQAGVLKPTHVFLQAGVGSMAGAVLDGLSDIYSDRPPVFSIVEPCAAACFYASVQAGDGRPHSIDGNPETIMAGLNCGTPSKTVWPIIRDQASFFWACDDEITRNGMRKYARPCGDDLPITAGESGAVTLGTAMAVLEHPELRKIYGITKDSVILLINTEGDTDPEDYLKVVGKKPGKG